MAVSIFVLEWWKFAAPEKMNLGTRMSWLRLLISDTEFLDGGRVPDPLLRKAATLLSLLSMRIRNAAAT
jgi:hypothetical protein